MQWQKAGGAKWTKEEPDIDTMQAYISGLQKDLAAMKLAQQQQQQQPQQPRQQPVRVANASVAPPVFAPWKKSYADATRPADWQCCMMHNGKHATCYRCGAVRPQLASQQQRQQQQQQQGSAVSTSPSSNAGSTQERAPAAGSKILTKESLDVALDAMMSA